VFIYPPISPAQRPLQIPPSVLISVMYLISQGEGLKHPPKDYHYQNRHQSSPLWSLTMAGVIKGQAFDLTVETGEFTNLSPIDEEQTSEFTAVVTDDNRCDQGSSV